MVGGIVMYVHFIDTSVFLNIIDVPGRNQQREEVMLELRKLMEDLKNNVLVLPFATIIETGNHIAHCGNGSERRESAKRFVECIENTINNNAPWQYYGNQMTTEDLHEICKEFPDVAMRGEGFGDLSIVKAYKKYKNETPAIHKIRIWSVDGHLKDVYDEIVEPINLRNKI